MVLRNMELNSKTKLYLISGPSHSSGNIEKVFEHGHWNLMAKVLDFKICL